MKPVDPVMRMGYPMRANSPPRTGRQHTDSRFATLNRNYTIIGSIVLPRDRERCPCISAGPFYLSGRPESPAYGTITINGESVSAGKTATRMMLRLSIIIR